MTLSPDSDETLLDLIGALLGEVLGEPPVALDGDATAADVPGWDSLAHVRLMLAIETRLGIRFEPHEITAPESVGDLVALIRQHRAKAG